MNPAAQRRGEKEAFRHSQNTEVCGDVRLLWDRSVKVHQDMLMQMKSHLGDAASKLGIAEAFRLLKPTFGGSEM